MLRHGNESPIQQSEDCWCAALDILGQLGHPDADDIRARLNRLAALT